MNHIVHKYPVPFILNINGTTPIPVPTNEIIWETGQTMDDEDGSVLITE